MSWQTVAICDEHFHELHPDKSPVRAVGQREHCHIEGCTKDSDIFVRGWVSHPEPISAEDLEDLVRAGDQRVYATQFTSDLHALACGFLLGHLIQGEDMTVHPVFDEEGNYMPELKVRMYIGQAIIDLRLTVALDEEEENEHVR